MKRKSFITLVLLIAFVFCAVTAFGQSNSNINRLADVVYDARMKEGGRDAHTRAIAIRIAVLRDGRTANAAQVAYDARINEGGTSAVRRATAIRDAVNEQIRRDNAAVEADRVAHILRTNRDASAAVDKVAEILGRIPETGNTRVVADTAKIIDAFQIARGLRNLMNTSAQWRSATGAEKQRLHDQLATQSLDILGRAGGSAMRGIHSGLVSVAVDGAKNLMNIQRYRTQEIDLIVDRLDMYLGTEYQELAWVLSRNNVPSQEIHNVINSLETLKRFQIR
jgi:hypothetical protein